MLGGQLKLVSTGSAPMSAAALNFLKVACACEVLEGELSISELVYRANFESHRVRLGSLLGFHSSDKKYDGQVRIHRKCRHGNEDVDVG